MEKWKKQRALLELISALLFGNNFVDEFEIGDELYQESFDQSVFSLIYPTVERYLGKENDWYRIGYQILASNMRVSFEHTEVHELMVSNKIPYVFLKGVSSASYYPDPMRRTLGDVDFLVDQMDVKKAGMLLENIGFMPGEDKGGIHVTYVRGESTWELHRSMNGIPAGAAGNQIREYLADIIETAVEYDTGNGIVRIPDDFHHGLVLLLHTASHMISEGVGLRHLCDWAVFANHFTDDDFRSLFEDKLKACGLWRFAQLLTLVSVKYLHIREKAWAGEADEELLEHMIYDIMKSGNFGQKDPDRYRQIKYISNRGDYTVDQKPTVLQLWDTIGRKAKIEQKMRWKVILDYVLMVITHKRRIDRRETLEQAAGRKKIYAEFHLFE